MDKNNKICIAGVGAVGGLLAAMLGKKQENNLCLIARGTRAEAIRSYGVVLHSQFYGEQICHPDNVSETGEEIGIQDYVFVCVKNYSLDQIAKQLRSCIDSHTVVVPVMNGVEPGERLRALFPDAVVCDALIYTASAANPDYSVTQIGSYTYMYVGTQVQDEKHAAGVKQLYEILRAVDFDVRLPDDIQSEIWQKYILNCAFNTVTARYLVTSGDIRRNEAMKKDIYALLSEAYTVGTREGVRLPENLVEEKYHFMMEKQAEGATSSMRRDVEAHRPTEMDAFLGTIVRKAARHGIEVPVTQRYYKELIEI